jgi:hypothetical protein
VALVKALVDCWAHQVVIARPGSQVSRDLAPGGDDKLRLVRPSGGVGDSDEMSLRRLRGGVNCVRAVVRAGRFSDNLPLSISDWHHRRGARR